MDHFEMVEKLRRKVNVSYEDAKIALEASDWDLLDALVYLEKNGKIVHEKSASYTTKQEAEPKKTQSTAYAGGVFQRLFELFTQAVNRINRIELLVHHRGKLLFSVPLLAFILLLVFTFKITLPVMVIALFFGITYKFKGAKNVDGVNRVMDRAADMMENIKTGSNHNSQSGE
ncbi:MAG: ubiquitin [Clostridiales bacterium]|nr:ubiquitin [Clostridiales bacterium]NLC31916.1 ubiquitin [Clostridiales bacterium]